MSYKNLFYKECFKNGVSEKSNIFDVGCSNPDIFSIAFDKAKDKVVKDMQLAEILLGNNVEQLNDGSNYVSTLDVVNVYKEKGTVRYTGVTRFGSPVTLCCSTEEGIWCSVEADEKTREEFLSVLDDRLDVFLW